jgi:dihydroflavonol-4-reductase
MYVLVTGCTGFVGFHTALALYRAGHRVRLGVRSSDKMRRVFAGTDMPLEDHVDGEIVDAAAVRRSLAGVDAVVHCAAMVNLEAAMAETVRQTNVNGTRNVVGQAVELGLRAIVYVSSVSAIFDPNLPLLNEASPLTGGSDGYGRSKKEADEYVRELMVAGASIAMTYPTGIVGPDDPGLSESNNAIALVLNNLFVDTEGGIQQIDARDLADIHVKLLERRSNGRYIVGGHYDKWPDFVSRYRRVLGPQVKSLPIPGALLRGVGRGADVLRRLIPQLPSVISLEAMQYATQFPEADDSKVRLELDHSHRNPDETLRDTVRWLVEKGHVDKKWLRNL